MKNFPVNIYVHTKTETEKQCALLFSEEWAKRTSVMPVLCDTVEKAHFVFSIDDTIENKDSFIIKETENGFTITAKTIRGLIFGYSLFLRKTTFRQGKICLIESIHGTHAPQKKLRGHQTGYRTTPNTYDAWDYDQFFQYQLDMMAFGTNIIEHNGSKGKGEFRNCLMRYEQEEFLTEASKLADKVDIDVSLWHANEDNEEEEQALKNRDQLYSAMQRLDYLFIPGGDPGSMQADAFMERCKKISKVYKKHHPYGQMHISAQAPHCHKDWPKIFINEISKKPEEIDAVIMGPNHAYPMHQLREKVPSEYPMRFYPDITHNLRCEYPVNFQQDDWHFAFCNTLSRESVNPRPTEFRTLNRIFSPYTIGGVSYSEGVHDDLNKAVWSALEWDKDADLREILLDYSRFFMPGIDEEEIADIIFLLEKNWQGDPVENPCIDVAYNKLFALIENHKSLYENWRFLLLYFRGCCDKLVKMRRCFENNLCKKAVDYVNNNALSDAIEILNTPFSNEYISLREELDALAEKLFNLIGIQLDVEHYHTDGWERGATLDTIDNNISDRAFLLSKLSYASTLNDSEQQEFLKLLLNRNKTEADEIYYSVALHNLNTLGVSQNGEFYMDIQGDRPYTKENPLPMSMTKVYDHFSFNARFGGFKPDTDYVLTVVYKNKRNEEINQHKITANSKVVYEGTQFGGAQDELLDKAILADDFVSASYILDSSVFINGALELTISEPTDGVNICELWIRKRKT
jgi:hypothetical protein